MAVVPNTRALTIGDGSNDQLNVDTVNDRLDLPNGTIIKFWSDAYTTAKGQIANGVVSPAVSTAAAALATSGTVTTSGVGVARVNPGSAVTAVIMATGTVDGQQCWVQNEAAAANTITMAASATSHVADGVLDVIPGLQARLYLWNATNALWYATPQLVSVAAFTQSGSAAAIATSGTVTTAGVNVARINPGSAVTATIMQAGTAGGQVCVVVNEAVPSFSAQMAASATSNVADGVNCIIPGLQAQLFIWDSGTSLWSQISSSKVAGALAGIQSATAVAIAASGTVTTAGVGHSRINPGSAVNALVMAAGTYPGEMCMVTNEASIGNYAQMAASATSNVADGINCIIPGLSSRLFIFDTGTSLWYQTSQTNFGTVDLALSSSAAATAISGTITTQGVGVARVNPGSAITAVVLQAGIFPGQLVLVSNEATVEKTVQFAASATSNIASGVGCIIPGLQAQAFIWNSTNWTEVSPALVGGALAPIQSATAPALSDSGTIATAGIGVSRVTPGSAVTACVLAAGTSPGQRCTVINEKTTAAHTITFAASGTSGVADGVTTVISGLRAADYIWNGSLWFHD